MKSTTGWRQRQYSNDLTLTAILNENGDPYNWNILVYKDGSEIKSGTGNLQNYKQLVNYKDEDSRNIKN